MLVGILRDQKSNYFHAKTQNDLDHEIATVPPYQRISDLFGLLDHYARFFQKKISSFGSISYQK